MALPTTLGSLRESVAAGRIPHRSIKDELRANVMARLREGRALFPGIIGFDETVVPQVITAILSKHNFILLGLRGQAKTRLLRALVDLLDEEIPVVQGCEIHDDPLHPICSSCRARVATEGDDLPIAWRAREHRYVEKLATPDVTIADMIGDVDPIKAVRTGLQLGDELTMHYGLLPRANRGIFAINELPDLASKVQVGLFNILQEGDVQIKGYPVRLRLDLAMVFSANPEDYTARGKIITPLKDRIGSEIRTHYPRTRVDAMNITAQEAWTTRTGSAGSSGSAGSTGSHVPVEIPAFVREIVEEIAFQARKDQKVDKRSGVSQRLPITALESVVSNAERRALMHGEAMAVPRVSDIYSSLPTLTGKIELEYEGELKGAEDVARELVRGAVATVFDGMAATVETRPIVDWFERGGTIDLADTTSAEELLGELDQVDGLGEAAAALGAGPRTAEPLRAATSEFVLEGLCALKKISRSEDGRFHQPPRAASKPNERTLQQLMDEDDDTAVRGKKKYYN
jgi:magnesium chelatase subunit I